MNAHRPGSLACALALGLVAGCSLPGRPKPGPEVPRPEAVLSFNELYGQNCAGCHGADGQNGAATNLANPEYQALIDDATLRDVIANGQKNTLMPGFGKSGGGMLVDQQVDAIVHGMRERWFKGNVLAGMNAPPYKATHAGNAARGQQVYATACAQCHGLTAEKPGAAGSILDGSFLALLTDQTIRTTVIAGRPDIGQPDWRNQAAGRALSDADVTDVTAWLMSQKPAAPGQPYTDNTPASERPGEAQPNAIQRPPNSPKGAAPQRPTQK